MSTPPESDPRAKASDYKGGQKESGEGNDKHAAQTPPKKGVRSLDQWATAASEAIEEAMRQGAFENLRGKGKPLNLGNDAFTPSDSALAFDILKNNDLTPGWMQQRNEIQREIEKWRANLRALVADANSAHIRANTPETRAAFAARWQAQQRALQAQIEALNRRISTVNLQLPAVSMEIFKLRLNEEIARAGATFVVG